MPNTPIYVIDGCPPAVHRHNAVHHVTGDGFHLLDVPGIDRAKWFHPSNVFPSRAEAKRELAHRLRIDANK